MTSAKPIDDAWGNKTDKKMPCRFSLNTTDRTYYFSASTWKEMEAWVRAFESWIGVDNKDTRARAPIVDTDESGPDVLHKCPSCGKTYSSIEDLSTHLVLRHPGEPVPLPADSGISDRKVCNLCGKWYQLDRDLQLHVQKRHGSDSTSSPGGSMEFSTTSISRGVSGGITPPSSPPPRRTPSAAPADGAVSAFDLPDVTTFSTTEAKQCSTCKEFFPNDRALGAHTLSAHGKKDDTQYGLISAVRASAGAQGLVAKADGSPQPVPRSANAMKPLAPPPKETKEEDWGEIDDIMGGLNDL